MRKKNQIQKNSQDDNDEGEGNSFVYPGSENTSSDYNNTNINKNEISTKVDKPSSDSITVKLTLGGVTKVQE